MRSVWIAGLVFTLISVARSLAQAPEPLPKEQVGLGLNTGGHPSAVHALALRTGPGAVMRHTAWARPRRC
jgi:hypothetical protein